MKRRRKKVPKERTLNRAERDLVRQCKAVIESHAALLVLVKQTREDFAMLRARVAAVEEDALGKGKSVKQVVLEDMALNAKLGALQAEQRAELLQAQNWKLHSVLKAK